MKLFTFSIFVTVLISFVSADFKNLYRPKINDYDPGLISKRLEFLAYTALHGKNYKEKEEFEQRFENWLRVDELISSQNQTDIVLAHNKFSDWS